MVTDDSGETVFTITEDLTFSEKNTPVTVEAIQGTIVDYEVNGVTTVTLDNLDSEYRLFFTETMIAENGIFISNIGVGGKSGTSGLWTKVDNLESATLNQNIYKFGILPNTGTCYVQFPQDIGTLIKNGLSIKYIVTSGLAGNVQANVLTTLYTDIIPKEFSEIADEQNEFYNTVINQDVIIKNVYATSNGKDPEDLDEAYRNYKKTVGTFNTLVTTEDYENAIYNLNDGLGQAEASNSVVSDRTNDLIRSTQVVQLTSAGKQTIVQPETEIVRVTGIDVVTEQQTTIEYTQDKMDYFDIGLYVLNPMEDVYSQYFYDRSFSVIDSALDIESGLKENKVVSHSFLNTSAEDEMWALQSALPVNNSEPSVGSVKAPYIFKNFYTLTGKVMTYYKVTEKQAEEIESNIITALYKKFNARNVEFGQAINYDDIVATIESADTRIKTLILNEPEYELRYMLSEDRVGSYKTSLPLVARTDSEDDNYKQANMLIKLLAKMIVGGHVQLYKWNKDIAFDFGQTNIIEYSDIKSITTENIIDAKNPSTGILPITTTDGERIHYGYTVQDNQNIILYAPNMYTKTSYGAYVNYRWDSNAYTEGFKSGNFYQLTSSIYLEYTDSNGNSQRPELGRGTIIRFVNSSDSSDILKMNTAQVIKKTDSNGIEKEYCTLQASQSIEVMDTNAVDFSNPTLNSAFKGGKVQAIWFTNRITKTARKDEAGNEILEYTLFRPGEKEYLLQENEYFIYTNKDKDELVILGSGTLLCRDISKNNNEWSHACSIPASSIIEKGQSVLTDNVWYTIDGYQTGFTIVELQLVTLGKNAGFRCDTLLDGGSESTTAQDYSFYITPSSSSQVSTNGNILTFTPTAASGSLQLFTFKCKDAAVEITNRIYFTVKDARGNSITIDKLKLSGDTKAVLEVRGGKFSLTGSYKTGNTIPSVSVSFVQSAGTKDKEYIVEINKEAYRIGSSLSLTPMRVSEPEYCEDMTSPTGEQSWIKLANYNIADDPTKPYSYGWSAISRYNVLVSSTYSQTLADTAGTQESLTLYTDDSNGNLRAYATPVSGGQSFLSNTLFSFAGGNDLNVSTDNDEDKINIYSFVTAALPTVDGEEIQRSSQSGQIELIYSSLYNDKKIDITNSGALTNFDLPFSFSSINAEGTPNTANYTYMIPIYLTGKNTKVTLSIISGATEPEKVILDSSNPVKYLEYTGTDFGGIRVVSWEKTAESKTENVNIFDTLKIGNIFVERQNTDGSLTFSDQVETTLNNIAINIFNNKDSIADLRNVLLGYFTNVYRDYDLTYDVPQADLIDTNVGLKENKNDLFFSNIVWDKNHICNKFTIPQFNTSSSSIKVAAASISK